MCLSAGEKTAIYNGTKLNGRYINQTRLIFDEDTITFGDRVFVFYEK